MDPELPSCGSRVTGVSACYLTNSLAYGINDPRHRTPPPPCDGHCIDAGLRGRCAPGFNPPCRATIRDRRCPRGFRVETVTNIKTGEKEVVIRLSS